MKFRAVLYIGFSLSVGLQDVRAGAPTAAQLRQEQNALRDEHAKTEDEYRRLVRDFGLPLPATETLVPIYDGFQKRASDLEVIPIVPTPEPGPSPIWAPTIRTMPMPVPSAQAFLCAAGNSVVPFSGELVRSVEDMSLPERGDIGFSFVRSYASLSPMDYGLGRGWDSNWNVTLRSMGTDVLVLHMDSRDVRFALQNDLWMPEPGEFLRLEFNADRAVITRSDLSRLEFEPASEQGNEERRWRLSAIASRHGNGTVNRLEVSYLEGCDRICFVTDPFGQRIDFSYDKAGRLVQVTAPHDAVRFAYDAEGGTLIQAAYPRRMNTLATTVQAGTDYAYDGNGRMVRETPAGSPSLVVSYDDEGRVVACAMDAKNLSQAWSIRYADGETIVRGPAPVPEKRYRFGKAPHPSLPDSVSIPARNAETTYSYNTDFLIAEETDAIGTKTSYVYDSENANPVHRGNRIFLRRTPAPNLPADWKEIGVETSYHAEIAALTKEVTYQIDQDGVRTDVKTEVFDYSPEDLMPVRHEDGGIVSRTYFNRFGNPFAEVDAANHCTLFFYSDDLPVKSNYEISPGSPGGGGLLVERVDDADARQIQDSFAAIGEKPPRHGDAKRTRPVAQRTRFALDVRGNVIRRQCGYDDTLYFRNSEGDVLAESDARTGTKIHEYLPSGKVDCLYTEFVPRPQAAFEGEKIPPFGERRFVKETFEYDVLLQLSGHSPTAEPNRDGIPRLRYERYPNGRVRLFRNASGLCREDIVDPETGFLREQRMTDERSTAVLATDLQYYPNGKLRSCVDVYGGKTEYRLDGFGNVRSTHLPNGRVDIRREDALGRVLEEVSEDSSGTVLSRTAFFYDNPYGLPSRTEAWSGADAYEVVSESLYDENGQKIAERGAHQNSWRHMLYDGLGRIIAVRDPSGDCSVTLYRNGCDVYERTMVCGTSLSKTIRTSGVLSELDDCGRVARRVPVDDKGTIVKEREEFFVYDAVGRTIRSGNALAYTETDYDSQGRVVCVRTTPKRTDQGERPTLIETEYLADGRVVRKRTGNTALVLIGKKNNVKPSFVDAPQENKTEFDGLGRPIRTIQPDGLTIATEYDEHSLPARMVWTHSANPKVLRSLSFTYSNMGQVLSISDALTGKVLQESEYDAFGRCIHSTDHGADGTVEARSVFDSMGRIAKEGVSVNGRNLPQQVFQYEDGTGITKRIWEGLPLPNKVHYWESETYQTDGAGRVRSLFLDDECFAKWDYLGNAVESRAIRESGLQTKWAFNDLGEPVSQRVLRGNESYGTLEYSYGPQGQTEYSSARLRGRFGKEYTYATYSGFDSYRRLTAQNGEPAIPEVSERATRRGQVFGTQADSLQALEAIRMAYDQTDSLWVRYSGGLSDSFRADAFLPKQTPVYLSAARVQTELRQPLPLELSSNRETTTAFWNRENGVDRLTAEEDVFDSLGNLVEFGGTFWNGQRKYPVTWALEYDPLGRLVEMNAKARENVRWVTSGEQIATLRFAYDSQNRRIRKTVEDRTGQNRKTALQRTTYTVFSGDEQRLVLEDGDGQFKLLEEYLWGSGDRELIMVAMPENAAEKEKAFDFSCRYYFQQDRNLNIVLVTKNGTNGPETVSTASYLGFGENATRAKVESVSCDGKFGKYSIDQSLDGSSDRWRPLQKDLHCLQLNLEEESPLSQLNIWTADRFPEFFCVFVLPSGEKTPEMSGNLVEWMDERLRGNQKECLVAVSHNAVCQERDKRPEWESPYRVNLGGLRGKHVAIIWYDVDYPRRDIEVREFEVIRNPDNPSAIAFAGQWLDRETDLYYQINRYRKAGSEKFISPDPLGFLDGPNMYAYAHANPLEWHDPDGRFAILASAGIGAAIGAILGGGGYALRCWLTGEEFSWKEFAIQTLVGALAGFISGLTFGICLPVAAGLWGMVGAGAAAGAAGGFVQGALDTGLHGGSLSESLLSGAKGAIVGGVIGAAVGGLSYVVAPPPAVIRSSAASSSARVGTSSSASTYSRPGSFRSGIRDSVWNSAKDAQGHVRDPMTGKYMSKNAPWDMGHKPGYEFRKFKGLAEEYHLPRKDFLDHCNDPRIYRPELPSSNRSHFLEDHTDKYLGMYAFNNYQFAF